MVTPSSLVNYKAREFNEPGTNYYLAPLYTSSINAARSSTVRDYTWLLISIVTLGLLLLLRLYRILKLSGSYIFLTSDSYLSSRYREKWNVLRTTLLAIKFSRRFPTEVREVGLEYPVLDIYKDIAELVKFGNEVVFEAIKLTARH
ncbi:hypothetical protein N7485_009483 [Penicillium canescens]|nr:hypothetical protein N7485_009483 [Penicillium canescens]